MTTAYALVGKVLSPKAMGRCAVIIKDTKIVELVRSPILGDLPQRWRNISGTICPGFIDLQINGGFGIEVGPDPIALEDLSRRLPSTGVTAFLPTAVSWAMERYAPFLDALVDAEAPGAQILGAHLEGPFLSPARQGAHDPSSLTPIDIGLLRQFVSSDVVSMVTFAPELAGAEEAISLLLDSGIVPSAGHTDATYEQLRRSADVGLSMATHLYNAMSPMGHRGPGTVGAVLVDNRVRASIIADGVHVHEGALRLAYRAKSSEGLALVTDAVAAAGMPDGEYKLSGRTVRLENGSVRLPDGTLAGSALTMDQAVRNVVRLLGISLEDTVCMASETPAKVLGLTAKGKIVPGADADLAILSSEGVVEEAIVSGKTMYRRGNESHGG